MLVIAAARLSAPDDPGPRGLWTLVALILLLALVVAHLRVLRAVARQVRAQVPGQVSQPGTADPQAADVGFEHAVR